MNLLKNRIEDFIKVYDDIMSHELCDQIIQEFKDTDWDLSKIGKDSIVNTDIRNCSSIPVKHETAIDKEVFRCMSVALQKYANEFTHVDVSEDTGYTLLKYTEGQFYIQHVDSFKEKNRALTCSLILNDNYEGGEFAFFDREMKLKLKKGQAIMFPSNFMFPHEILPVKSGTRYSIITWFV